MFVLFTIGCPKPALKIRSYVIANDSGYGEDLTTRLQFELNADREDPSVFRPTKPPGHKRNTRCAVYTIY